MKNAESGRRCFVAAYWGARRESVDDAARRLAAFISGVGRCDDRLSGWFMPRRSRRDRALRHIETDDRDELVKLLLRGRNRLDSDGTIIDRLGFDVRWWNGKADPDAAGLAVHCGSYSLRTPNVVTIDLPIELGGLREPKCMGQLLSVTANSWDPDWAGVMFQDALESRGFDPAVPFVDWMVYVSRQIPQVPEPSSISHLRCGSLITVTPHPPQLDDASDQATIANINAVLSQ